MTKIHFKTPKGIRDVLPEEQPFWHHIKVSLSDSGSGTIIGGSPSKSPFGGAGTGRPADEFRDRRTAMKITCPNCSATYQIPDNHLANGPRSVRCASCQTVWTEGEAVKVAAEAPAAAAKPAPEPRPEPAFEPDPAPKQSFREALDDDEEIEQAVSVMDDGDRPDESETLDVEHLAQKQERPLPARSHFPPPEPALPPG